jgi:hypothetical protein
MVSAGGSLNMTRNGGAPRGMRAAWRVAVTAVLALVAAAGCVLLAGREPAQPTELGEVRAIGLHHKLTREEKEFVLQATSTPDVDLHKAAKLQSERAAADMDKYYSKQQVALQKKDEVTKQHLKAMHKRASTVAAQKALDRYFEKTAVAVKKEHMVELKKHKGTGAAARAEANLYFKQLQAKQEKQNKADEARLRAEETFHSKHGTALAAAADLNAYFDQLQAKTKQRDIQRKKLHPVKSTDPYSFITPMAEKNGGEAVKVHKHDEEGIQMSTKKADDDLSSYFDNLDKKEAKVNQHDVNALAVNHKFAQQGKKPNTAGARKEIKTYFHTMDKKMRTQDERDKARLRKDNDPVNLQEGTNYATPAAAKARAAAKKADAARKLALRQKLKAKQAQAHKLEGSAVSGI